MSVPGKLFQPSLMCVGKARSLAKSGAPERLFTFSGSGLTHKHLTGKACQGQTLKLIAKIRKLQEKSFLTLVPGVKFIKLYFIVFCLKKVFECLSNVFT